MGVAYKPGQTLTENDLKIVIRNSSGVPVDPFYIRYSLFDYTTGVEVLMGAADRVPATTGVGMYYVDATIPLDANIGDWVVRWNFRETVGSPLVQVVQEFNVVAESIVISVTGSDVGDLYVRRLRILLRDNDPDRNYRFRPPSHEKFLQAQTQVFGYIWEDYELYEYVLMAIDDLNSSPPVTGVTLGNIPDRWRTAILLRAGAFACFAIALNWIADEFSVSKDESVDVKDGDGNIYDLSVEELFEACYGDILEKVHTQVKSEYEQALKEIGETDPHYMIEDVKDSFLSIKKNNMSKVKEAFDKRTLKVKSMVEGSDKVEWMPVKDVMRHNSLGKKLYKISTSEGSSIFTEDHSIFLWESKKAVKAEEIIVGDEIVGGKDDIYYPMKVTEKEEATPEEYTYDLCVPGSENFLLKSGILAHNSYSISGVSLDIDKSAKYESMKNNFIQEWDKSRELIKRSIKIVKGLKQPRYGIGISSALGPYSAPGVQSRRNWVSGFSG